MTETEHRPLTPVSHDACGHVVAPSTPILSCADPSMQTPVCSHQPRGPQGSLRKSIAVCRSGHHTSRKIPVVCHFTISWALWGSFMHTPSAASHPHSPFVMHWLHEVIPRSSLGRRLFSGAPPLGPRWAVHQALSARALALSRRSLGGKTSNSPGFVLADPVASAGPLACAASPPPTRSRPGSSSPQPQPTAGHGQGGGALGSGSLTIRCPMDACPMGQRATRADRLPARLAKVAALRCADERRFSACANPAAAVPRAFPRERRRLMLKKPGRCRDAVSPQPRRMGKVGPCAKHPF